MSEDKQEKEEEKPGKDLVKRDTEETLPGQRTSILLSILLSFVLLVLLGAASYYGYRQLQQLGQTTQLNTEAINASSQAINRQFDDLSRELKSLMNEFNAIKDRQQKQGESLETLYQMLPRDNKDWALAEVEQLIIIASHQLRLEHDVNTAIVAMSAADERLKDMGDPALIPVREQITADINALRDVSTVDTSGLAIYLADLIERSDTLPLKGGPESMIKARPNEESKEEKTISWRELPAKIWHELKSLVVIKQGKETRKALLLPEQEYFLYQNLKLELENARLAVLRHDTENLHTSVGLLVDWLNQYFDTDTAAVANVIDSLEKMASLQLDPPLPDISSSLETLRAVRHAIDQRSDTIGEDIPQ